MWFEAYPRWEGVRELAGPDLLPFPISLFNGWGLMAIPSAFIRVYQQFNFCVFRGP